MVPTLSFVNVKLKKVSFISKNYASGYIICEMYILFVHLEMTYAILYMNNI